MLFIKFALVLFVLAFVAIVMIAYSFYKQVHRVVRRFRPEDNGFSNPQGSASHTTTTKVGDNTIVDNRSEMERNKKIIKDNEGEYVDYK